MRFWVELKDHVPHGQTVTSLLWFNTFNTKQTYSESVSGGKGAAAVTEVTQKAKSRFPCHAFHTDHEFLPLPGAYHLPPSPSLLSCFPSAYCFSFLRILCLSEMTHKDNIFMPHFTQWSRVFYPCQALITPPSPHDLNVHLFCQVECYIPCLIVQ